MPDSNPEPSAPLPPPIVPPHARHKRRFLMLGLALFSFLSVGSLYWWRTPSVLLTVDGVTRRIHARRGAVADLLKEQQIALAPDDFTTPSLTTPLSRHTPVKITRVKKRLLKKRVKRPPLIRWQTRTRANLRRVLVQRGFAVERIQTWQATFYDGKEVKRQLVSEKTARHPFFTLTLFNNRGFPIKTYDLLKAKTLHMLATGYYVGDPMVPGDETRLGYKLQRGLVAIDPKVIPLGTRLYIPGYGYSFAADTGSAIKGLRIDLAVKDAKEEKLYNHRRVTIYLLDKTRKW